MKTKWVATLNAKKMKVSLLTPAYWRTCFFIVLGFFAISCSKSDDSETGENESVPEAQSLIVYTDIEPDFEGDPVNNTFDLDLNNDQIANFTISWKKEDAYEWLEIVALPNTDNGIISVAPWYTHPLALDGNWRISGIGTYSTYGSIMRVGPGSI